MLAVTALVGKKPILSMILSAADLVFAFLSGYNWRLALVDSGKDPAWLGFQRYPASLILLLLLAAAGLACLLGSAILMGKQKQRA